MTVYTQLIRPWLFAKFPDPEDAHEYVMAKLRAIGELPLAEWIEFMLRVRSTRLAQDIDGVHFPNPVILAAGFDKAATTVLGLQMLGFGGMTVGTVTYDGQQGNPRQRIFRYPDCESMINRMKFNNPGADRVAMRLQKIRPRIHVPIGVSMGPGEKVPADRIESVIEEYEKIYSTTFEHADYHEVNLSSPNTAGLTALQVQESNRKQLLRALHSQRRSLATRYLVDPKPLFAKISPDLTDKELDLLLEDCVTCGISGIVSTNTTRSRDGFPENPHEEGGASGRVVYPLSLPIVARIRRQLPNMPIIAAGGIFGRVQTFDMMVTAGANLVQVYTGLIYRGPGIIREINRDLVKRVKHAHIESVADLHRRRAFH